MLQGSKLGHMTLTFTNAKYKALQGRKFQCRKVTFSYLKGPKHSRNHGQKIVQFSEMKILILNKKNTRHFNISQIFPIERKSIQRKKKFERHDVLQG